MASAIYIQKRVWPVQMKEKQFSDFCSKTPATWAR